MGRENYATTHQNAGIAAWRFKPAAKINSFAEAEAFLAPRWAVGKLGSNMSVIRRGPDTIAIRLYDTDILIYHRDGTFEADNGGWNTPTTSARLNMFGPPGWYFGHSKKKLYGNGKPMSKGVLYNVVREQPVEPTVDVGRLLPYNWTDDAGIEHRYNPQADVK